MIHAVVAVYDSAVGAYMRPFVVPSRAAAQRSFKDEVNRAGGEMFAHPDDYVLWYVCDWDDEKGVFSPGALEPIVRGKDVKHVS